jgi:hypothetical protein
MVPDEISSNNIFHLHFSTGSSASCCATTSRMHKLLQRNIKGLEDKYLKRNFPTIHLISISIHNSA